jgi:hypothetical protein
VDKSVLADLRRSGLGRKEAGRMRVQYLSPVLTGKLVGQKVPAYKIPYFEPDGRVNGFYRVRFLETPATPDGKARRYSQPKGTLPRVYWPPFMDWPSVIRDAGTPIFITEGEKKAAKACAEGLPCIGLGGVWSWKAKKAGASHLPDFDAVVWTDRRVVVVFDSDASEKAEVLRARDALCGELLRLGAKPFIVNLPADRGRKVGLDDYLLKHGRAAFLKLPPADFVASAELWKLNRELAVIRSSGAVYHEETRQLLNAQTLTSTVMAHRRMTIGTGEKIREVSAVVEWLKWPHRRSYRALVYEPGGPMVTDRDELNIWRGWGCEPRAGDLRPWKQFMDYVFRGEPASREWFECWLAAPLQKPGLKLFTAVLIWSRYEGNGKSFIGEIMKRIYGENYGVISQAELHGEFNAWAYNKQFIMGEEITGSDRRHEADNLKHMLTRSEITINVKYQPQYTVRDCINYYFTSNNPNALFMGDTDRRMFVHEIRDPKLPDAFYRRLERWMLGSGPSALFDYLRRKDISRFNPKKAAPMTRAKREMTALTRTGIEQWARDLYEQPEAMLVMNGVPVKRDLWRLEELRELLDPSFGVRGGISSAYLGTALRSAGFDSPRRVRVGNQILGLWAVRHREKWAKASPQSWTAHYREHVRMLQPAPAAGHRDKGGRP